MFDTMNDRESQKAKKLWDAVTHGSSIQYRWDRGTRTIKFMDIFNEHENEIGMSNCQTIHSAEELLDVFSRGLSNKVSWEFYF